MKQSEAGTIFRQEAVSMVPALFIPVEVSFLLFVFYDNYSPHSPIHVVSSLFVMYLLSLQLPLFNT